jgi:hypothetical protein
MTPREITTLMHRLFRFELQGADPYVHLMVGGVLDRGRVTSLLDKHIAGDELLIFQSRARAVTSRRGGAFEIISEFIRHGQVRIADPKFRGRVIIEPMGVGAGCAY